MDENDNPYRCYPFSEGDSEVEDHYYDLVESQSEYTESFEPTLPLNWATEEHVVKRMPAHEIRTSSDPQPSKAVKYIWNKEWRVEDIEDIHIQWFKGHWCEMIRLRWKKAWAILRHVRAGSCDFGEQLERKKLAFQSMRNKDRQRIEESLRLQDDVKYQVCPAQRYSMRSIEKYNKLPCGEEVVFGAFNDSFEHCSALFANAELWKRLANLRIKKFGQIDGSYRRSQQNEAIAIVSWANKFKIKMLALYNV